MNNSREGGGVYRGAARSTKKILKGKKEEKTKEKYWPLSWYDCKGLLLSIVRNVIKFHKLTTWKGHKYQRYLCKFLPCICICIFVGHIHFLLAIPILCNCIILTMFLHIMSVNCISWSLLWCWWCLCGGLAAFDPITTLWGVNPISPNIYHHPHPYILSIQYYLK